MNEAVTRRNVGLLPDDRPARTVFSSQVCSSHCTQYPQQVHHTLPVHRPGNLALVADWLPHHSADYFDVEIRCGDALVAEHRWKSFYEYVPPVVLEVPVSRACAYEVKFTYPNPTSNHLQWTYSTPYAVTVDHPK